MTNLTGTEVFQVTGTINGSPAGQTETISLAQIAAATPSYNPVPIPAAVPYNFEGCTFSLQQNGPTRGNVKTSLSAKQIFALYSTAQSAPAATYYVATSGGASDSNNGLTPTTAWLTLGHAMTVANAGGVPTKIYVQKGTYPRQGGGNSNMYATVDVAWVAWGGPSGASYGEVIVGTFDEGATYTADATYTNTYSGARSTVNRVMDTKYLDRFGHYTELTYVSSAAVCNITPNTWSDNGGNTTLYIHRADGQPVVVAEGSTLNTRVILGNSDIFRCNANNGVNMYIGTEDGVSHFRLEGGQNGAVRGDSASNTQTTPHAIVCENVISRYAGGYQNAAANAYSYNAFYGVAWHFNCEGGHNMNDCFNLHNSNGAGVALYAYMVCVNCTGVNTGLGPNNIQQSNNGITNHDGTFMADFSGYYENGRGGTCRSVVNGTTGFFAGTYVKNDLGDIENGGAISPLAFSIANAGIYWCYRTVADMPAGTISYQAETTGGTNGQSQLYLYNIWPTQGAIGGLGTVSYVQSW